jgi:hypothetical protein
MHKDRKDLLGKMEVLRISYRRTGIKQTARLQIILKTSQPYQQFLQTMLLQIQHKRSLEQKLFLEKQTALFILDTIQLNSKHPDQETKQLVLHFLIVPILKKVMCSIIKLKMLCFLVSGKAMLKQGFLMSRNRML